MRNEGYCSLFGKLCPLHSNLKNSKSRCKSNDKNEEFRILTSGYLHRDTYIGILTSGYLHRDTYIGILTSRYLHQDRRVVFNIIP